MPGSVKFFKLEKPVMIRAEYHYYSNYRDNVKVGIFKN